MGSTGTANFTDYGSYKSAIAGVTGGRDVIDKCALAFQTHLEEVENCEYFRINGCIPQKGMYVRVDFVRRMAMKDKTGLVVGYLPTSYNYLRECMNDGFVYEGVVSSAIDAPLLSVSVAITPNKG